MTKEEKRIYDIAYRAKNRELLKAKKKAFNETDAGRRTQKRAREKRKDYHNEYCRKPEQREKEKHRRHIRENKLGFKVCLRCGIEKNILDFESYLCFPDGRLYHCKSCEENDKKELGITIRGTMQAIRMSSLKMGGNLTRKDMAKHPYFIESYKYLILLKQLTK